MTKPKQWYFVVRCAACDRMNVISEAPPPGQQPGPYGFAREVRCACGDVRVYPPDRIDRFQAPDG